MQGLGIRPDKVILSGGGARSSLWKKMLADIFESPCSLVNAREGAAYGAALLASVGCDHFSSIEDASASWIEETEHVEMSSNPSKYHKNYKIYQSLYPRLKESFRELSAQ
jgi:xylulokinase